MKPAGVVETGLLFASCLLNSGMVVLPFVFRLCGYGWAQMLLGVICSLSAYTFYCIPASIESPKARSTRLSPLRLNLDVLSELAWGQRGYQLSRALKLLDTGLSSVTLAAIVSAELACLLALPHTVAAVLVLGFFYFFGYSNQPTMLLIAMGFNQGFRTLGVYAGALVGTCGSTLLLQPVPQEAFSLDALLGLPLPLRLTLGWGCMVYCMAGATTCSGMYAAIKGVRHSKITGTAEQEEARRLLMLSRAQRMMVVTMGVIGLGYSSLGLVPHLLGADRHMLPSIVLNLLGNAGFSLVGALALPLALLLIILPLATGPTVVCALDGYLTIRPTFSVGQDGRIEEVTPSSAKWKNLVIRVAIIGSQLAIISCVGPQLTVVVAMAGCTAATSLNIALPLALHLSLNHHRLHASERLVGRGLLLGVLLVMGTGTVCALRLLLL